MGTEQRINLSIWSGWEKKTLSKLLGMLQQVDGAETVLLSRVFESHEGFKEPKRVRQAKQKVRLVLMTFIDTKGVVHIDFSSPGSDSQATCQQKNYEVLLCQDNAPAHNALTIWHFLTEGSNLMTHSTWLRVTFFSFSKRKEFIKGHVFRTWMSSRGPENSSRGAWRRRMGKYVSLTRGRL